MSDLAERIVEAAARAVCVAEIGVDAPNISTSGQDRQTARAAIAAAVREAGLVKLLTEAHACMRATGWHLAPASDESEDPTLALAVADIEERTAALLRALAGIADA